MVAVLLSLGAALSYGVSDFVGGLVSRRTSAWAVAAVGSTSSTLCAAVTASLVPGDPTRADFAWSVLAGVGSGVGVAYLYRGFSAGQISIVAPISGVGAALVPVAVGVATGERPGVLVWLGILLAVPGIWLVSAGAPDDDGGSVRASVVDGVLAGLGFGVLFAAIGQVPAGAGFWPTATSQAVATVAVVALAGVLRAPWRPRDRVVWWALAAGPFGAGANLLFLLATQQGLLTVSSVITSLYPASTVLLALLLLREQITGRQTGGLLLCAVTVALVAAG